MEKQGVSDGSIIVVRSWDSVLTYLTDDMDEALLFIKSECKRDFSVDYDLCQLINGYLVHISNSRILAKVGCWPGFDITLMEEVIE